MLRILWCRGGINHDELPLVGQAVNGDLMHISDIKIASVEMRLHGAYIGTLGLMECKKYVLYVIRKC